jgi:hypothetical protein
VVLQQGDRRLVAQVLDVERAPTGDVEHPLPELGRAGAGVRAADVGVALLLRPQLRPALGAVGGHDERALGAVPGGHHGTEHLGDDVAGLADDDRVADEHALARDLRGVVQGGQLHRGAGDLDRLHERERGDPAGPPHVDPDVEQLRRRLLRWVLEGDGPAGSPRGGPEPALQRDLVDLDHDAVDLVLDRVALVAVALDVGPHALEVGHDRVAVAHRESERAQPVVGRGLPVGLEPPVGAHAVHHQPQRAGGGDPGVLLPEGARGGVAGIGERRLALLDHGCVDVGERRDREVDLAAHLQQLRDVLPRELPRDVVHRADVGGDVLPGRPVAAGGGPDQPSLLVDQRDGHPVDLQLAQVGSP